LAKDTADVATIGHVFAIDVSADTNDVIDRGNGGTCLKTQGDVQVADGVVNERTNTAGRVAKAGSIAKKRICTGGRIYENTATGAGARLGTEGYIPPEGPGTPQADLYSLGKALYEASTGTDRLDYPDLPRDLDTMAERETFLKLNSIVLKACDNDIRKRYQTATEISEDLMRLGIGRPVQEVRRNFLRNPVIAFSAVLLGALALAFPFYWLRNPTTNSTPEKSVAVLPFDNLSDDKQNAYFAAGVQDEITSNLARIAELKVISRTSANLYKSGKPRNSRDIGRQLGVAHLLEGSVQRIGNRLRVNAQLINAPTDTHVWAQTYDRGVADLFAIQSEIAQTIAGQLYAKISPAEKRAIERPPTADLTAFDLYTHAKDLSLRSPFTNRGGKDLLLAADLLNQAVARDPSFFQAYCQLAFTHDYLYFFGHDRTPARLALAEAAIQAAFRLRPDAGEAHLARAENLYRGYLDHEGALAELEVARQSLPNNSHLFQLIGSIERRRGRCEESIRNLVTSTMQLSWIPGTFIHCSRSQTAIDFFGAMLKLNWRTIVPWPSRLRMSRRE
jgi:TolB-like protein